MSNTAHMRCAREARVSPIIMLSRAGVWARALKPRTCLCASALRSACVGRAEHGHCSIVDSGVASQARASRTSMQTLGPREAAHALRPATKAAARASKHTTAAAQAADHRHEGGRLRAKVQAASAAAAQAAD